MAGATRDVLLDPGSSGGYTASPFALMTTELNTLGSSATAISSVNGASGVFTQTNFINNVLYEVIFISGGSFTPAAGGNIAGWWAKSPDAGVSFEKNTSGLPQPRPPDMLIPLSTAAYAANDVSFGIIAPCPWPNAKLFVMNNAQAALPASGNIIKAGPVAWGSS